MTRRLYAHLFPLLLVISALVSCAFDPPSIQRTPREVAAVESTAKSRVARRGAPSAPSEPEIPGEEIAVPGDEVAALEVDLTNFKERLIGLDSDEINDLLGTPGLERSEPPALIWQYRSTVCTVDIFMFDDGAGSTVDHVEVRGASDDVDEKTCFTGLLRNTDAAPAKPVTAKPAPAAVPAASPKPAGRSAAQPARATPSAAPAASSRGAASRTPVPRQPAATPPVVVEPPEPARRDGPEYEDDPGPPPGAAASAPKSEDFEIEDDPDKAAPLAPNDDDPSVGNEDLVE